jgi:hypothetical protein
MIDWSRAFLVAALGALVLGLASTAMVGGLVGVDVARAQSPAPSAGTAVSPVSGVDDTTAAADPDPDAQLDDTAAGGLDNTDLGGPIDDTGQPAADPPPTTTPGPSPGSDGATPPSAGDPPSPASGAPGASPPPIYLIVNAPSSAPISSGRQSAPKPKSSKKKHSSKKKRESSKKSKRRSKRGHSHRRTHTRTTSGRVGRELGPRPFPPRRATAARVTRRRSMPG